MVIDEFVGTVKLVVVQVWQSFHLLQSPRHVFNQNIVSCNYYFFMLHRLLLLRRVCTLLHILRVTVLRVVITCLL